MEAGWWSNGLGWHGVRPGSGPHLCGHGQRCALARTDSLARVPFLLRLAAVRSGLTVVDTALAHQLVPPARIPNSNAKGQLTERERQIMRLVSEGLSNKEIGRRLNITDGTIKVHLHHVFQKLEIDNRTVLAALALSTSL